MTMLRSPRGCPWDRRQTHRSLRPYLIEETYEAIDAIDRGDLDALRGELGDVLFQAVFHAELAAGAGRFDIADVIDEVTAKLIRRHPHVFTPSGRLLPKSRLGTPAAVVEQWERIKARAHLSAGRRPAVLAGIPRALPALVRAHKIGARVATVGFDWPEPSAVVDKIEEEVRELRSALTLRRAEQVEEMGDLLFALANLSRKLGIEPEAALRKANDKFTRRFAGVERAIARRGQSVQEASLDEMEAAWTAVKAASSRRAASAGRSSSQSQRPARRSRG
jgi:nucleoside triphosphate diphosphatase